MQTIEQQEAMIRKIVNTAVKDAMDYHMEFMQGNIQKSVNLALAQAMASMIKGLVEDSTEEHVPEPQPVELLKEVKVAEEIQAEVDEQSIEEDIEIPDYEVINGTSQDDQSRLIPIIMRILQENDGIITTPELHEILKTEYKLYITYLHQLMYKLDRNASIPIRKSHRGTYKLRGLDDL